MATTPTVYLSRTDLGRRYGKHPRTIKRGWKELKTLPAPDLFLGGREFWKTTTVEEHDRLSTATPAKAAPKRRYDFVTGTVTG